MELTRCRTAFSACRACLAASVTPPAHGRPFSQAAAVSSLARLSRAALPARTCPLPARRAISLFNRSPKPSPAEEEAVIAPPPPSEAPPSPAEAPPSPADARRPPGSPSKRILASDDLFHSYTNSPIPSMRQRAAFMKQHAYCPHPDHRLTRLPLPHERQTQGTQPPAHVDFECPDCGIPVYCSERHWLEDYEHHTTICNTLKQINEDDHDLRSGRHFSEFRLADVQMDESIINFSNWDTYLYTRDYLAINADQEMRQVTRMLTYPVTIASVLHELGPYHIRKGGRLTPEGLKSMSALRYTLHPPMTGEDITMRGLRPKAPPVRIFVLGARAESSLPRQVWVELAHCLDQHYLHLIMIGPESMQNRDDEFPLPPRTSWNPFGAVVEDRVFGGFKMSTIVDYYHTIHKTGHFHPYDPYLDCFVLFHPGLGHPSSSHEWAETIPQLLETKCPIIVTGYTEHDMQRDINWVKETCRGEFDMLLEPGENIFRSLRWDLNDLDPQDVSCGNWGLWAFRGKRYEATRKDIDEEE
ncbi:zinc-finger of mitochondrial splicing suppressor 51-domain-containing protein [Xylariaceae sp. FL0804]|nr:zinc-finger of mitochondrial splicing suppressor 51-domain-containing protein [Xylariaceae sp. FL0804]